MTSVTCSHGHPQAGGLGDSWALLGPLGPPRGFQGAPWAPKGNPWGPKGPLNPPAWLPGRPSAFGGQAGAARAPGREPRGSLGPYRGTWDILGEPGEAFFFFLTAWQTTSRIILNRILCHQHIRNSAFFFLYTLHERGARRSLGVPWGP